MSAPAKKNTGTSSKKTAKTSDFSKGITTTVDNLKSKANDNLKTCEKRIKQSPRNSVLIALGAGYCLSRLPVGTLITIPLRLTALLAKPALLTLGAVKVYDLIEKQSRK